MVLLLQNMHVIIVPGHRKSKHRRQKAGLEAGFGPLGFQALEPAAEIVFSAFRERAPPGPGLPRRCDGFGQVPGMALVVNGQLAQAVEDAFDLPLIERGPFLLGKVLPERDGLS